MCRPDGLRDTEQHRLDMSLPLVHVLSAFTAAAEYPRDRPLVLKDAVLCRKLQPLGRT